MKNLLSVIIFVLLFVFSGCESNDKAEEDIPATKKVLLSTHGVVLVQNQQQTLSLHDLSMDIPGLRYVTEYPTLNPKECKWSSGDTYVADINEYGAITGKHVGKTRMYMTMAASGFSDSCDVEVIPLNRYVYEPVLEWGIDKKELNRLEVYMVDSKGDDWVKFIVKGKREEREIFYDVTYKFDDDKLIYCQTIIKMEGLEFSDVSYNLSEIFDRTDNPYQPSLPELYFKKKGCVVMARELVSGNEFEVVYAENAEVIGEYFY